MCAMLRRFIRTLPRCLLAGLLAGPVAAAAQAPASAPAARAASAPRPGTELRVIEDDHVRIEETRVRGQVRRIVVHDKSGKAASYEIQPGAGGRDPSQDKSSAGQRVWSVLKF